MRRMVVVLGLMAGFALPAASQAETPTGFRFIGPPAMLNTVVFAGDGTAYGTVEPGGRPTKVAGSSGAVWRSTDHGHTWSASYRTPDGAPLGLLGASNVNPNTIYASVQTAVNVYATERIDTVTGKAVALPFASYLGEDVNGTAYGSTYGLTSGGLETSSVVRCPRTSDACDAVPLPITVSNAIVVDPNSAGVLSSLSTGSTDRSLEVSTDGGASWIPGAALGADCACYRAFAGPTPGQLFVLGTNLNVSLDAGLTWRTTHPLSSTDPFVVGVKPSAVFHLSSSKTVQFSDDAGATFRTVTLPSPGRSLVVDPTDINHLVLSSGDETMQSWDGGGTWSDIADARFGMMILSPDSTAGSGRRIYAVSTASGGSGYSIWLSDDMGATWQSLRRPSDERRFQPVVSRDDPRVAYLFTVGTSATGTTAFIELRTADGGATWTPVTLPGSSGVFAIAPGDPSHVYARGNAGRDDLWESRDGGLTWAPVPADGQCAFALDSDPTSPTGQRLRCLGWGLYDPHVSLSSRPLPYADGLFGSPDRPGALAVASGTFLGDVQSDWSWSPLLAPTGIYGPSPPSAVALAAWPAKGGTTFIAYDPNRGITWARRGIGRWWRVQVSGRDLTFVSLLDSAHVLVRDVKTDGGPLAVVDLTRPTVDSPQVQQQSGGLACVVPWTSSDATTAGYAWLRDGVVLPGVTHMLRPRSRYDRGHALTCRATARNGFGSVTLTSSNAFPVGGTPVRLPHIHIEDSATVATHLHCSARKHVAWVRDEQVVPHHHARTYTARPNDANHALACQTRLVDGTIVRSAATFVTP